MHTLHPEPVSKPSLSVLTPNLELGSSFKVLVNSTFSLFLFAALFLLAAPSACFSRDCATDEESSLQWSEVEQTGNCIPHHCSTKSSVSSVPIIFCLYLFGFWLFLFLLNFRCGVSRDRSIRDICPSISLRSLRSLWFSRFVLSPCRIQGFLIRAWT